MALQALTAKDKATPIPPYANSQGLSYKGGKAMLIEKFAYAVAVFWAIAGVAVAILGAWADPSLPMTGVPLGLILFGFGIWFWTLVKRGRVYAVLIAFSPLILAAYVLVGIAPKVLGF